MRSDPTANGAEVLIVGGGVVGLSVAYGLLARGRSVIVVDEGDRAWRASRGNFGLVWVQGKGLQAPHYARWTSASAQAWPAFAEELRELVGIEVSLKQPGGLSLHLSDDTLAARAGQYEALRQALGDDYPFERLDGAQARDLEPALGPEVRGALFHPHDGHVNPLRLLRALAAAVLRSGGRLDAGAPVESISPESAGFSVRRADGRTVRGDRLVLCAGLGSARLGPMVGLKAPVRPQRGQVLVTEKVAPLLSRPTNLVRQVDEGSIQIGDSKEEVGFDDEETIDTLATIARRAVRLVPALAQVPLVRSWGALRVMSPDGLPMYQHSHEHPGASLVTCHSGITLAAVHARRIPAWLEADDDAPDLSLFTEDRFDDLHATA